MNKPKGRKRILGRLGGSEGLVGLLLEPESEAISSRPAVSVVRRGCTSSGFILRVGNRPGGGRAFRWAVGLERPGLVGTAQRELRTPSARPAGSRPTRAESVSCSKLGPWWPARWAFSFLGEDTLDDRPYRHSGRAAVRTRSGLPFAKPQVRDIPVNRPSRG